MLTFEVVRPFWACALRSWSDISQGDYDGQLNGPLDRRE